MSPIVAIKLSEKTEEALRKAIEFYGNIFGSGEGESEVAEAESA